MSTFISNQTKCWNAVSLWMHNFLGHVLVKNNISTYKSDAYQLLFMEIINNDTRCINYRDPIF